MAKRWASAFAVMAEYVVVSYSIMEQEYLEELIQNLTSLPKECETVEFKENNAFKGEIGQNVSALSNSANLADEKFAYLVFGIQDKTHKIVGTNYRPTQEKVGSTEIEMWLHQHIEPKVNFLIYEFTYQGKHLVLFQIPPATTKPVTFSGVPYVRIGSATTKLSNYEEKERKIWNNIDRKSFEKNIAKENLSASEVLDLLDYSTYFTLIEQETPSQTIGFVEKMVQHNLLKEVFEGAKYDVLNIGALLFAKNLADFPSVKRKTVRIITYKGNTKEKREREQEYSLGYAVAFDTIINYIQERLPVNEDISKSFRKEQKMYPEVALREFVANALIHQDFSIAGTGPMVEIFDNRIEITNPGKPLIDTDRFIDHPPRSRNEEIANLMRQVGICEESGTGVDRALIQIEMYQLPAPKFEAFSDFTRVTLYAHKNFKSMSKEERIRACFQHCVLLHVEKKRMTNATLRKRLNIADEQYPIATTIINETIEKGFIKVSEKPREYVPDWA